MLDVARHNRARGAATVRLFEAGAVYLPTDGNGTRSAAPGGGASGTRSAASGGGALGQLPHEPHHLGAVLAGAVRPSSWRDGHPPTVDFFTTTGVLEGLMRALRADWRL